jgi:hypothetical protein
VGVTKALGVAAVRSCSFWDTIFKRCTTSRTVSLLEKYSW